LCLSFDCFADRLRPVHCALVVFGILLLNHVVHGRGTLFAFNGEVEQLWANNFTTVVHDSTRLWIVEFYAAWCGYCQRLAPEYAGFAEDIRGLYDCMSMMLTIVAQG